MSLNRTMLAGVLAIGMLGAMRPAVAGNVRVFVRQEVADYGAWRKVFDDFDATRRQMGVIFFAVFCSIDDPKDVTFFHDFLNVDQARAFVVSPEFKDEMKRAGVRGKPQIWLATKFLQ